MSLTAVFAPALLAQPGAFADNIVAYPLGLTAYLTPAASPLPGHLLASTGPGRLAALGLLLARARRAVRSLRLPGRTCRLGSPHREGRLGGAAPGVDAHLG